jgi:hypothetical protein
MGFFIKTIGNPHDAKTGIGGGMKGIARIDRRLPSPRRLREVIPVTLRNSIPAGLIRGIMATVLSSSAFFAPTQAGQRHESFDSDPGWEGVNNRTPVNPVTVTQDFGFSLSQHAEGQSPGEIGGQIWRSITPAFYGFPIPLEDFGSPLTAEGKFKVTSAQGSSGVLIGWFNHSTMGWRPPSWLGFRLDDGRKILVEYNTQTNQAGGARLPEDPALQIGESYSWTHSYNPDGAGGQGEVTFTVEGPGLNGPVVLVEPLGSGHKQQGAAFDRFGLINLQRSGNSLEVYFDDLLLNGVPVDLDEDPEWDGQGNRVTFEDTNLPGANDFGWSQTQNSGGQQSGELGGRLWRTVENNPAAAGAYGDDIGNLSMEDSLLASGVMTMTEGAPDSAALFGWYNSSGRDWRARNFLGVVIEGPSRVGHYFRPFYGTSQEDAFRDGQTGPVLRPDFTQHTWSMSYDPEAANGNGELTVTLDGESKVLQVSPAHRAIGAEFDRFGLVTMELSGAQCSVFFDDIDYTFEDTTNETPFTPTPSATASLLPTLTATASWTPTLTETLTQTATATATRIDCDYDGNGICDEGDLVEVILDRLLAGHGQDTDFDGDGMETPTDLFLFAIQWRQ